MMETMDHILVKQSVVDSQTQETVPQNDAPLRSALQSAQSASWTTQGMPD